jgi:hypothetical protein
MDLADGLVTKVRKAIRSAAAVLVVGLIAPAVSSSAQAAADFPSTVAEILNGQTDGPMSRMSPEKKNAMIQCVNGVLTGLPNGQKRYVLEGTDFQDREKRFGKVVLENRAEWKQKIADGCAKIALSGGI